MPYEFEIKEASNKYKVPVEIIQAVITIESSWNPKAYRYEGKKECSGSYGLMQVCPETAEWNGYPEVRKNPEILYDPAINIDAGTRYLRWQYNRYGNWVDAVSAYNLGKLRKRLDGSYVNQEHINKFLAALDSIVKKKRLFQQPVPTEVASILLKKNSS